LGDELQPVGLVDPIVEQTGQRLRRFEANAALIRAARLRLWMVSALVKNCGDEFAGHLGADLEARDEGDKTGAWATGTEMQRTEVSSIPATANPPKTAGAALSG
jgi:hypothetical protein